MNVLRFAPSPTGPLHLGHAFSALTAHDRARAQGGTFLLRIEDIDGPRSRPELAEAFRRDLAWLGLEWEEVPAQSTRLATYAAAAQELLARGLWNNLLQPAGEKASSVAEGDGLLCPTADAALS